MNYEHLTQEELIDLINAYDSYIMCAADAGMLVSGWTPVCIDEFYQHEYQEVWLQGGSFDYFYDEEELVIPTNAGSYRDANGTEIFRTASGDLMCRFDDEVKARPLRSHIQDIQPGDGFIVGALVRTASDAAHKNMDERDEPWIIYDDSEKQHHWVQILPHGYGQSHKEYFYNPILQNRSHIKHLQNYIGIDIPIKSIIVFSERCTLKNVQFQNDTAQIINRQNITNTVFSLWNQMPPDYLSKADIDNLFKYLYPFTQVSNETKRQHIEHIKKQQQP